MTTLARPAAAPTVDLFGVPVAALRMADVVQRVDDAIRERTPLLVGVVNAAKLVNMRRDAELAASVLASDIILADGASVVLASRLLGHPLPERVTGIDLMHAMLERGSSRQYRFYCLGATPEVLSATERAIAERYPGVICVGRHHGYFSADEQPAVAADIRQARPDVLLVAMTSPKKERFLAAWGPTLGAPVCHGVGGAFDVVAGKVKRAPLVWQRLGLEWLYRVLQEPGRLWKRYLVTNTAFVLMLATALVRTAPARAARAFRGSEPQ